MILNPQSQAFNGQTARVVIIDIIGRYKYWAALLQHTGVRIDWSLFQSINAARAMLLNDSLPKPHLVIVPALGSLTDGGGIDANYTLSLIRELQASDGLWFQRRIHAVGQQIDCVDGFKALGVTVWDRRELGVALEVTLCEALLRGVPTPKP